MRIFVSAGTVAPSPIPSFALPIYLRESMQNWNILVYCNPYSIVNFKKVFSDYLTIFASEFGFFRISCQESLPVKIRS
jgi:hypothetical protein